MCERSCVSLWKSHWQLPLAYFSSAIRVSSFVCQYRVSVSHNGMKSENFNFKMVNLKTYQDKILSVPDFSLFYENPTHQTLSFLSLLSLLTGQKLHQKSTKSAKKRFALYFLQSQLKWYVNISLYSSLPWCWCTKLMLTLTCISATQQCVSWKRCFFWTLS